MRSLPNPRRLLCAAIVGAAAAAVAAGAPSCGTDAVGIDACRKIEAKRCEVAPLCSPDFADVEACNDYYRDQCLHGIENPDKTPSDADVKACIEAIAATAACAGAKTFADCAKPPALAFGTNPAISPCEVILKSVDALTACAFVANPAVDAGVLPDAPAGAGGGGGAAVASSSAAASTGMGGAGGN